MHENSFNLCRAFAASLLTHCPGRLRIADVGSCDVNGTYRVLFERAMWSYVGFDIRPGTNVDFVLGSLYDWNLPEEFSETFDVVISGQTMEHVAAPWKWIKDVAKLLKPGGILWLAVPNTEIFHEHPIDCWRVWPDGMRAIFAEGGLQEIICYHQGPDTIGIARKL